MSYIDSVNRFFSVLLIIFHLFYIHYVFFALVGVFTCKSFPHSTRKNRFGLIIPARNEEAVVATIIDSIRKSDYPQELLEIFVVAHNCSDNTAAIARSSGAHVYEYDNPEEKTMGYAIRYLFKCIEEDFGSNSFDGFFIFNADNSFDEKYFDRMNDAFEYYDRKKVISSFRQASNFNENIMTLLYGAYFATSCYLAYRGRTVLNISNRIFGCGYLFNSDLIKDGWKYVLITEDLELSAVEYLKGTEIRYCDDAVFYDEQPTSIKIMWRQRLRWARGLFLVSGQNFLKLVKAVFEPGRKNRYAVYDMATFNSRPCLVVIFVNMIKFLFMSFSPLFGESLTFAFQTAMYDFIISIMFYYALSMLVYLLVMFCGRKRFGSVSPVKATAGLFLFPIFLLSQFILDIQAMFSKNLQWKPIPHTGRKDS